MPKPSFGKQDERVASSYSFKTIIMRNYLLSLLVALLAVTGSLPVSAQEAYAVLTSDQTLTFYYDNQRATRQNYQHTYDVPKLWETPAWAGNDDKHQENIKHVVFDASFSACRPTSTSAWFAYCSSLQDIEGIRNLNTENVTNMSSMFEFCQALTSLDVSKFNTQKVTDMDYMFAGCKALTSLDVSNFNTSNVTHMLGMFLFCKALTSLDVSKFNTENVTDMNSMFSECKALTSLDVSNFNTENVTNMFAMFSGCKALTSLDVSNFNTENVTSMGDMFSGCQALTSLDVSKFNTEKVTDMRYMFYGCTSLTTIYCNSNWKVGQNVDDKLMFDDCRQLKGTNTSFDENKTGIEMANPNTGYFTKTVIAEAYAVLTPNDQTLTFYYDNQRPNHQNYERIYDMPEFQERPTWASDYNTQNIKHVVFDVSFSKYRPISTCSWFEGFFNLKDIEGMRNLNTKNVTKMYGMFSECIALTSLDVSNFNTENVTSMGNMFSGCRALTSLDVSNFNTQNVTRMRGMFSRCKALTSLDVSKFNTEKVTDMSYMFFGCESLTTIFCNSNWKVGRLDNDYSMFENCTQLKGTDTVYDRYRTGIEMANPTWGYFTNKTTGIDTVKTADRAGDDKAYDLSGRRVNESYKGIVIKNGKKYIQK